MVMAITENSKIAPQLDPILIMMIISSDNPSDRVVTTETISDDVPTDCVLPELLLATDVLDVSDVDDTVSVETTVVSEVSAVDIYVVDSVVEPIM